MWNVNASTLACAVGINQLIKTKINKTASFQKEAMRTQVALWFFNEINFV